MKLNTTWKELEEYGFDLLTGEACGLMYRLLFDVTKQGKKILQNCFGIPELKLNANWNSGDKENPHVGSILLTRDMFVPLAIFALLNSGYKECWATGCGGVVAFRETDADIELWKKQLNVGRRFAFSGTAGDRNRHEMTGRVQ